MTTPLPAWAALVRDVPDFPQPGILFKDITTLIKDGDAFRQVIGALVNRYRGQKIDRIVGVESRGFIFAAPLAYELGAGFVPVRKPGKLPADAIKTEYLLEYGANTLEVHKDAIEPGQSVLIVDDVLATGGSAAATVKLVEELGGAVIGIAFVIELGFLNGRKRLGSYELFSLLTYSMKTVEWHDDGPEVWLIDQTRLPLEEVVVRCRDYRAVALAIKTMQVRGAPAIGVTAAMGVALAAVEATDEREWFDRHVEKACKELASTRPTAINLFWAIQRMQEKKASLNDRPAMQIRAGLIEEAKRLAIEDEARCRQIGQHGAALFADGDGVLTHCNAGALACVDYGTALGPLRAAHELGKRLHVFVDETRPFLQGSRLTAWELGRDGIDSTLITDNMAAYVMGQGKVQKVIVGADRIAANGDVANKIGTYGVAIIAHAHGIPFYVAAPTSTIDFAVATGADIPIEERSPDEVTHFRGVQVAPHGMRAAHPAFDVTPARYVTAIITEEGIHEPPYSRSLAMVRK